MSNGLSGVYRGQVVNNVDPQTQGRLQVVIPSIDTEARWAMPSTPYAGANVGFFALPPIGANVWIAFEAGDLTKPVWLGCFWAPGELPAGDAKPDIRFLRTPQIDITIEDDGSAPPKLVIKTNDDNRIELAEGAISLTTSSGARVKLSQGQITLDGWPLQFSPLGALKQLAQG